MARSVVASRSPWPPLLAGINGCFERGDSGKTGTPCDAASAQHLACLDQIARLSRAGHWRHPKDDPLAAL
jgi:hypothetical protein